MIPKETLSYFKIVYESDGFHIKSWIHIDGSYSNSSDLDSNDDSDDQTDSSND